jgi:hypothetical protein
MGEKSNNYKKAWSSIKLSKYSFVEWNANRSVLATVSLKIIDNYILNSNVEVIFLLVIHIFVDFQFEHVGTFLKKEFQAKN